MFIGEVLVAMAALHELGMRSTQRYASYMQASSSGHLRTSQNLSIQLYLQ